ncbi:MAG: cation:proton antiporter [bacterium]
MTTYTILIILSGLVIFSYLFDLFAKQTRFPSVVLLLILGIAGQIIVGYFGIKTFDFSIILPALGTIGLILIVFEGTLELKYDSTKNKLIRTTFFSALIILLTTVFTISAIIELITKQPFHICLINSIPLSIISSAIAIPSAANIAPQKKEFVIYESSFSDILGIIFFDFMLHNNVFNPKAFMQLGFDILAIVIIATLFCLFLIFLIKRIVHPVKFFLIISILILAFAVGKQLHLSSLIIVLAFGLFLNNAGQIDFQFFRNKFLYPNYSNDLSQLSQLSAESTFLVRTFFFVLFGFSINLNQLKQLSVFMYSLLTILVVYIIRLLYLKFIAGTDVIPELFIAPRGLISILLYLSIPDNLKIPAINQGVLVLVVLITTIIMAVGIMRTKRHPIEIITQMN